MKSKLFFLGAASLLLASCSSELDLLQNEALGGGKSPLSVNVAAESITKALVSGNSLPNGSKIGVKLVKSDGNKYDNQTYNNIYYSATDGNTWTIDATKSILLSSTEGKAYAYYPYTENASLDFTAIPISSAANPDDQVDYMFGNEASGLKNSNPTASFTLSHAMSIVNFTIAKGSYTGTGSITSVKMSGNTASNIGTMNAVAGTVTATNAGYEFTSTNSLTLGSSSTGKFIVVPSGTSSKLDFKVVMDGQTYTASTAAVTLASGQVYKYTLTMNSTGLSVSTVTVTPWGSEQDKGSLDTELYDPWAVAKATDGVYAIKADGSPVAFANANDASYAGVAFVVNGKAYQVAKVDAVQEENTEDGPEWVFWQKENWDNIVTLTDYTTADGTNGLGLLPFANGTYCSDEGLEDLPHLSGVWSAWPSYTETASLSDFNGQENTAKILAFQNNANTDFTIGKTVKDFRGNATYNEGKNDWFVPSLGELAFMFLKKDDITTILTKVSGAVAIKDDRTGAYWSSSEYNSDRAWGVNFSVGLVASSNYKNLDGRVRLVRAI